MSLGQNEPPKGHKASWEKLTTAYAKWATDLDEAAQAKNKAQFETAYRSAIQGCNACHGSQTSSDFSGGFGFIKVQVPQKNLDDIYSWAP